MGVRPAIVLCAALAACAAAGAPDRPNAVFCQKSQGALQVLAIQETPSGALRFGLSEWTQEGQNISVFGVAPKIAAAWQYQDPQPGKCRIDFAPTPPGGFTATADAHANCRNHGGAGTFLATAQFTAADNEGPVTSELIDAEAFQHAGRCAGGSEQ
jgi:hypothetical protein